MSIDTTKGIAGLKGALRYVRAYRDQVFVVKLGGDVLSEPETLDGVAGQLALLTSLGIRIVGADVVGVAERRNHCVVAVRERQERRCATGL